MYLAYIQSVESISISKKILSLCKWEIWGYEIIN